MLDIFNDDAFSVNELTVSINTLPVKAARLGEMGLFRREPITTPFVTIESQGGVLRLIPTTPRGTVTRVEAGPKRKIRAFPAAHLALGAEVFADDVSGLRMFGSEDQIEQASTIVNRKLESCKASHEVTHEFHRAGAIQGIVLDADGTTEIVDLFDIFDVAEVSVNFDFSLTANQLKAAALTVIETVEDNLGGSPYDHVHAMVSKEAWADMMANESISELYNNQTGFRFGAEQQREGFLFADIYWEPYRAKVGSQPFIQADTIRFFPVGAPDMFIEANAPADFMETVNQPGLPYYAKQERKPFDTGIDILTKSCPGMFATRPKALVKGINTTP